MCQLQDPIFKSQKLNISLVATTWMQDYDFLAPLSFLLSFHGQKTIKHVIVDLIQLNRICKWVHNQSYSWNLDDPLGLVSTFTRKNEVYPK
jgi:hypothetical protein